MLSWASIWRKVQKCWHPLLHTIQSFTACMQVSTLSGRVSLQDMTTLCLCGPVSLTWHACTHTHTFTLPEKNTAGTSRYLWLLVCWYVDLCMTYQLVLTFLWQKECCSFCVFVVSLNTVLLTVKHFRWLVPFGRDQIQISGMNRAVYWQESGDAKRIRIQGLQYNILQCFGGFFQSYFRKTVIL